MEPNNATVVLLGMGTVFLGLIALVLISLLMSGIVRLLEKGKKPAKEPAAPVQPVPARPLAPAKTQDIADRGAFMAAISAAVAQEMGADVNAIRILSVKKLES